MELKSGDLSSRSFRSEVIREEKMEKTKARKEVNL